MWRPRRRRMMAWLSIVFLLYVLGPLVVYVTGGARLRGDWSTASHTPVGLAPDPKQVREAIVQAYAAQALAWRGVFSVHTHAVGKDYVAQGWALTRSPSGTGSQVSLSGLVGLLVGLEEGVEFNVLALNVGVS